MMQGKTFTYTKHIVG